MSKLNEDMKLKILALFDTEIKSADHRYELIHWEDERSTLACIHPTLSNLKYSCEGSLGKDVWLELLEGILS